MDGSHEGIFLRVLDLFYLVDVGEIKDMYIIRKGSIWTWLILFPLTVMI